MRAGEKRRGAAIWYLFLFLFSAHEGGYSTLADVANVSTARWFSKVGAQGVAEGVMEKPLNVLFWMRRWNGYWSRSLISLRFGTQPSQVAARSSCLKGATDAPITSFGITGGYPAARNWPLQLAMNMETPDMLILDLREEHYLCLQWRLTNYHISSVKKNT